MPSITNNLLRDDLQADLPEGIRNSWSRRPVLKPDVRQLVDTCLNYERGVEQLLQILQENYEDETALPLKSAVQVWRQIVAQIELYKLLKSNPPEPALVQESYGSSLPHGIGAETSAQTLEEKITHLGELEIDSAQLHPLLHFVESLAAHTPDEQHKLALRKWTDITRQSIYVCSDEQLLADLRHQYEQTGQAGQAGQGAVAYALIELIPDVNSHMQGQSQGQHMYGCEVVFWDTAGKARHWECAHDSTAKQSWTLAELPQRIAQIFKENGAPRGMIIEFLLPDELLSCDVDQWDDKTMRTKGIKVGWRYPIVVRPLSRMKDADYRQRCYSKWLLLHQQNDKPQSHFHWLCGHEVWDRIGLVLELEESDKIFCMGLTFMPPIKDGDEILDLLLDAGLPVALWPRLGAESVDSHEKIKEMLSRLLDMDTLHELPEAIKRIRGNARKKPDYEIGSHLTLLWDDPTRIPPKYADETDPLYEPEML